MCSLERIVALLPWCSFVCSSVCLSGTGVYCDHTVHFSADLSLRLYSPMFWAPWHQSVYTYSQPSFSSSTWKRGGVWMCKLGLISQERLKIYRVAQKSKLLILSKYVNKTEKIGGTWTNTKSYRENEALCDIFTWNILLHNCFMFKCSMSESMYSMILLLITQPESYVNMA